MNATLKPGHESASLAAAAVVGADRTATASVPSRRASLRVAAGLGTALFLTMLPVTMMVPVLRELVTERFQTSTFWTHSFMSINMIGAVLTAPLAGALADRFGRRKSLLIAALLVNAALILLMRYMESMATLLAVRFVEGGAHILAISTIMALASDWAPPGRRGRMMGVISACLMFGTACGAPLGGRIGRHAPLLVFHLGAGFALAAALIAAVTIRDAPDRRRSLRLRAALALVTERRELLVPYAYAFIDRFCVGVIVSSFVLYLGDVLAMPPERRGGLLALFLIPFALLCYPVGRLTDRWGRVMPMCVGSLAFGLVYASYGFISAAWLPAAMVVSGVLSAVMFAPNLAMCSDLAPADRRASAYAGFNMAGSLGFVAGPLVGGTVCGLVATRTDAVFAYRTAFVVAGAAEVLCAMISLPWLLALRRAGRTI